MIRLFRIINQDAHWVSLTPLQRCSRCILQPKPNGPRWWRCGFTPLQRSSRCILLPQSNGPRWWWGGGSYSISEMQSVYSAAQAERASLVVVGSYPSAENQSVYFATPADWASLVGWGGGLTQLLRCSRCILQSQQSGPHWCRGLIPLQRCSRCILQPQPNGPRWWGGGRSYPWPTHESS